MFYLLIFNHAITTRKRSLGQGNIFTRVCHWWGEGCVGPCDRDTPTAFITFVKKFNVINKLFFVIFY